MTVKEQVLELVGKLPDSATWEDVLYELYVQQKIERGVADIESGHIVSDEDVRREFLK